jgi:hypothetical protein
MAQFPPTTVLAPSLLVGAALMLGACSSTTYGTGTTAASQTVKDVTGILSFGSRKKDEEPINYEPRPPIVEPPAAALPPPGSDTSVNVAGNWPVDPDEEQKRIEALVKERQEAGQSLKFTVPDAPSRQANRDGHTGVPTADSLLRAKIRGEDKGTEATKKMFANAKTAKVGSFDEDGNPVRRYLTEPPALYREPDLESPVDITEKPKKKKGFKWPDLWPF